ncbi:MAG: GGDEF domain-containing protein, partial [Rhodoferax sp.]|nr:GGDEF domain-containing protein [Rhodoferax sp.]
MDDATLPPRAATSVAATATAPATATPFRLVRYFALTSLVGVLLVLAGLIYFYRAFATEALEAHETQDNVALTRIFASTLWPRHASYVKGAATQSREQLRSNPQVALIRADVLQQMKGLPVVKVKIYDLQGLTVFSTDEKQIGENKSDDDGVQDAIAGKVSSEITFENQFDAFEKVINDRNLISSYVPIRVDDAHAPEGVMEVYSDVTAYVHKLEQTTWEIAGVVLGSLGFLYGFLYAIVRRADQTLQAQAQQVDKAHQATLAHQALHDPLTGLPNRESLSRTLAVLLKSLPSGEQKCAVLCLGLDGFKEINDSLGHLMGDAALVKVGRRLQEAFGRAQITARMGGDEFVVCITGFDGALEVERLVQAVERAQKAISAQPIMARGHDLSITASVGVAIYPDDGRSVAELLQAADVALSHAKKQGRNGYQFHTAGMNDRALDLLLAERDLRRALAEQQFVLHYQP